MTNPLEQTAAKSLVWNEHDPKAGTVAGSNTLDEHIRFARAHRSPETQALHDAEQAAWVAKMAKRHRSLPRPTAGEPN